MAKKKTEPVKPKLDQPKNTRRIDVKSVEMPPKRKIEEQDRLNAAIQFSYEHCCVDPVSVHQRFSTWLEVKEQPWQRELRTVGKEWIELDKGCWLEPNQIGFFVLTNLAGKSLMTNPTDEEQKKYNNQFIEIAIVCGKGVLMPLGVVRPGKFASWELSSNFNLLRIRCLEGPVQGHVTVFPK